MRLPRRWGRSSDGPKVGSPSEARKEVREERKQGSVICLYLHPTLASLFLCALE